MGCKTGRPILADIIAYIAGSNLASSWLGPDTTMANNGNAKPAIIPEKSLATHE
jgi:hypothetical protein